MRAKVVHDDLNSGGGSERLAVVTIGLLTEMGFEVDLASFTIPSIERIKGDFGDIVDSLAINPVHVDFFSLIGLKNIGTGSLKDPYGNDNEYDLIVNTHADVLPYYDQSRAGGRKNIITYCHFPLVPRLVGRDDQSYIRCIERWTNIDKIQEDSQRQVLENAARTYELMMKNTIILTNSHFSYKAIKEEYGSLVNPVVVYPPVNVVKFRDVDLYSRKREDKILVVSRFSPDKQLENVIEICKVLVKETKIDARMILVGNIASGDEKYLENLKASIHGFGLENNISIEVDANFDLLLDLMGRSKIYLHPLAGEPFGISIVEAMSAGLIPVVPDEGGCTEFVPEYYQFHTHQQAAEIIGKILIASDNDMQSERNQLSVSVSKFSAENYKARLRKVIESLLQPETSAA